MVDADFAQNKVWHFHDEKTKQAIKKVFQAWMKDNTSVPEATEKRNAAIMRVVHNHTLDLKEHVQQEKLGTTFLLILLTLLYHVYLQCYSHHYTYYLTCFLYKIV